MGFTRETAREAGKKGGVASKTGIRKPNARLAVEDVSLIRALYANGESSMVLAADFGVSVGNIHAIVARRSWKDVP